MVNVYNIAETHPEHAHRRIALLQLHNRVVSSRLHQIRKTKNTKVWKRAGIRTLEL